MKIVGEPPRSGPWIAERLPGWPTSGSASVREGSGRPRGDRGAGRIPSPRDRLPHPLFLDGATRCGLSDEALRGFEIFLNRRLGRETVQYVSDIATYDVDYRPATALQEVRKDRDA